MPESRILDESASVVLSAAGYGLVVLQTLTPRQRWQIANVSVSGTSVDDTVCRVYFGTVSPGNQVAASQSGNQDNVPCDITLYPNQRLTVEWMNGTPGARQTASLVGTYDVAR